MAKQRSKAELLQDIRVERRRLENILAGLAPDEIIKPGVVGEWSVKDVLAHLTAWEQLFLSWYEAGLQGRVAETSPVGMSAKAIDALNQIIYDQYRLCSMEEVLEKFQNSYQQVLAAVEAIPEEDLFAAGRYEWTGKWNLADYVAGNTCNHYHWAKNKIRQAKEKIRQ